MASVSGRRFKSLDAAIARGIEEAGESQTMDPVHLSQDKNGDYWITDDPEDDHGSIPITDGDYEESVLARWREYASLS